MAVRVGTAVCLVALAGVVLLAGCGKMVRPEAQGAAATNQAAAGGAASAGGAPSASGAQRAVSPEKRPIPAEAGSAAATDGPVTGCPGPQSSYRLNSSPHHSALPRCWRFQAAAGQQGGGGRP